MITSHGAGRPAWVDLLTPGRSEAMAFYRELFGWTFSASSTLTADGSEPLSPLCGSYTVGLLHGTPVAGLSDAKPSPEGFPAPPTAWTTYLPSLDVDVDAERIEAAGGTVLVGPLGVADRGRMVVAADPTGAAFGLWQPVGAFPDDRPVEAGAPCWHECVTGDPSAAAAFYERLFDHDISRTRPAQSAGTPAPRHALRPAGAPAEPGRPGPDNPEPERPAGRVSGAPLPADMPPSWLAYFAVEDADGVAARAGTLGAAILEGPHDSPHGRLARIRDPQGAVFAILRPILSPA